MISSVGLFFGKTKNPRFPWVLFSYKHPQKNPSPAKLTQLDN